MAKIRKNEAIKDINLYNFISKNKKYSYSWTVKKTENEAIQECLDKSSKSGAENRGEPDLIYINENKKLLILIENKDSIKDHKSKDGKNPKNYAVDGIKHYLTFFTSNKLQQTKTTTSK